MEINGIRAEERISDGATKHIVLFPDDCHTRGDISKAKALAARIPGVDTVRVHGVPTHTSRIGRKP